MRRWEVGEHAKCALGQGKHQGTPQGDKLATVTETAAAQTAVSVAKRAAHHRVVAQSADCNDHKAALGCKLASLVNPL